MYSDHPQFADPVALGDNLADYVDRCGGVVVAAFANASIPFAGRFATDDYWVIRPASQTQGNRLTLGVVHTPNHRIKRVASKRWTGAAALSLDRGAPP